MSIHLLLIPHKSHKTKMNRVTINMKGKPEAYDFFHAVLAKNKVLLLYWSSTANAPTSTKYF